MRYRQLDANGDMVFGGGQADFYIDQPEAPGQAVETRLGLWLGEWFLDTSDGTPWATDVLGVRTAPLYDLTIRDRILGTPNVTSIDAYSSSFDRNLRRLTVDATLSTAYGTTTVAGA